MCWRPGDSKSRLSPPLPASLGGLHQPGDQLEDCRLAASAGAGDGDELTTSNRKAHAIDGAYCKAVVTVLERDLVEVDEGGVRGARWRQRGRQNLLQVRQLPVLPGRQVLVGEDLPQLGPA